MAVKNAVGRSWGVDTCRLTCRGLVVVGDYLPRSKSLYTALRFSAFDTACLVGYTCSLSEGYTAKRGRRRLLTTDRVDTVSTICHFCPVHCRDHPPLHSAVCTHASQRKAGPVGRNASRQPSYQPSQRPRQTSTVSKRPHDPIMYRSRSSAKIPLPSVHRRCVPHLTSLECSEMAWLEWAHIYTRTYTHTHT